MKTFISKSSVLFTVILIVTFGCSKSDDSPSVTTDDAANVVGSYVSTDFNSTVSDASSVSTTTGAKANGREANGSRAEASTCGVSIDSAFTRTSAVGAAITYSFQLNYGYKLSCNGIIPTGLDFQFTSTGDYSGPKVSSQGASTGEWTVTGFDKTSTDYTVNGTFTRTETLTEKSGAAKSFDSNMNLTATALLVDKTTKKIQGGTINLTMAGAVTGGKSYNYVGTITFTGNGTATILIGTTSYSVDLTTGTVTKS